MEEKISEVKKPVRRPYFLPPEVEYDILPTQVQEAINTIVQPCYDDLVVNAATALERSTGVTLVYLLTQEVLDHFEMGRFMDLSAPAEATNRESRDKMISRHLRLISEKQKYSNFMLRLQEVRVRRGLM